MFAAVLHPMQYSLQQGT